MRQKVEIIKHRRRDCSYQQRYEADPVGQPGSPVVGRGKTPLIALINLLAANDEFNIDVEDKTKTR